MFTIQNHHGVSDGDLVRSVVDHPTSDVRLGLMERLTAYEKRFSMSTSDMRAGVLSGDIVETGEICKWLMLHNRLRALSTR